MRRSPTKNRGAPRSALLLLPCFATPALLEEVEDLRDVLHGDVHVPAAGDFDVFVAHAERFHLLGPAARASDGHQLVLISLDQYHGHVLDLLQLTGWAKNGRGDRRQAGPNLRVLETQVPGAAPTHRVAHQVGAALVDIEFLANDA